MLSKPNRLPGYQVPILFKTGRRVSVPGLQFIYQINNNSTPSQFAVIASTRLSKKAVIRNRLKRVGREALRGLLPDLQSGIIGIIDIRDIRLGESMEVMKQAAQGLLSKANLNWHSPEAPRLRSE